MQTPDNDLPNGLVRLDTRETEDYIPESYPEFPGIPGEGSSAWKPETTDEKEISAAHLALDKMGVPRSATLSEDQTTGGVAAKHTLRLHGRLRLLNERLQEQGVNNLFPEE